MGDSRTKWLVAGMLLGWAASVSLHALGHRLAGVCFDVEPARPVMERPVMPAS